jgi:acyl carrier protein
MTTDTVARLLQLAARRFRVDPARLSPDDDLFSALGIDSVQALALLSELEDTFDVEIPDYELQDARTFRALAAVVDRRTG